MSQTIWEYTTILNNGKQALYTIIFDGDNIPDLNVENSCCGFVNGNKSVIEIYTTALLNYSPSTSESPRALSIPNALKVIVTLDGEVYTEIYNFEWGLYTLSDGSYYHATRLTGNGNVQGTNIATGLLFETNTKAIQYMNHQISPLEAINGLTTTWNCYWTGNRQSGYNLRITWECENLETYGNINDYSILIGTAGQATPAIFTQEEYYEISNFTANSYSSSEISLNSNQIRDTFFDRKAFGSQCVWFYLTLTLHDNINNKNNYTTAIKFVAPIDGTLQYDMKTDIYIIEYSEIYNGDNDGSKIIFTNGIGEDDSGYNGRKDSVNSMIDDIYGRGKGFISTYAINQNVLNLIGSAIWADTFSNNILSVNSAPIENCVSTMKFPMEIGGADGEIYIGNVDMNATGGIAINDGIITIGEFTINPIYNNFLDFSPYSKTFIYLPFIGYQELPISEMINRKYILKYIIDYVTGECNAVIYYNDAPFLIFSGVVGIEIPISNQGIANLNRSQFPTAISTITSAINRNPTGSINGIASMLSEIPHPSTQGVASSECNAKTCVTAFLLRIYPQWQEPSNYAHQYGKPCCLSRKIKNLKGFTIVASEFDTSGLNDIALDELEEIRQIMSTGFYI